MRNFVILILSLVIGGVAFFASYWADTICVCNSVFCIYGNRFFGNKEFASMDLKVEY